mmetsp:Transcript_60256/g.153015  ORF Transcript_60256/g.153015 Transcript_60256/m.153015 type:complete len:233 (+) Transcript_60256:725-1423(+)
MQDLTQPCRGGPADLLGQFRADQCVDVRATIPRQHEGLEHTQHLLERHGDEELLGTLRVLVPHHRQQLVVAQGLLESLQELILQLLRRLRDGLWRRSGSGLIVELVRWVPCWCTAAALNAAQGVLKNVQGLRAQGGRQRPIPAVFEGELQLSLRRYDADVRRHVLSLVAIGLHGALVEDIFFKVLLAGCRPIQELVEALLAVLPAAARSGPAPGRRRRPPRAQQLRTSLSGP